MGRAPCCAKEGVNRGAWTAAEDRLLIDYIKQNGEGKWRAIPKLAGLKRCGKSCRLRWLNYLRPDIKRGNIEPEEDDLIIRLHRLLGNRWSLIAGRLPGRTDNEIKNYWNTTLSKKQSPSPSLGGTTTAAVSSTSAANMHNTTTNPDQDISKKDNKKNKKKKSKRPPAIPLPTSDNSPPTPSKAVRTKAIRCTKLILPISSNNPTPDVHITHNYGTNTAPAADSRQNDVIARDSVHKYRSINDINVGENHHQFHHDYYHGSLSTTSSGEPTNSGCGDEEHHQLLNHLDYDNFPSDFHEVVTAAGEGGGDDQMMTATGETLTAADTDFWSMLNDWVLEVDDNGDDNNSNNIKNTQREGYQLLR